MKAIKKHNQQRKLRAQRTRVKLSDISIDARRPRLSVFRSNKSVYGQIIDDKKSNTLATMSSKNMTGTKTQQAFEVGKLLGEKSIKAGVKRVVFDKGSYRYHGRVKALADGARASGLDF